jgi:hypothetical protein
MVRRTTVFVLVIAALCGLPAMAASNARSFVASNGLDSNTCSRIDPCRSFAFAITQTATNGEVVALDSAGYGQLTITKAITIVAPLGVHAGITAGVGDAVAINAGTFEAVTLRNLYVNWQGATNGITLNTGGVLHIEHCVVNGFQYGINLVPTTAAFVAISDTVARQDAFAGIYADSAQALEVSIDHCHLEKDGWGVLADRATVAISNTVADGGSAAGFHARGTGGPATLAIESCVTSHNNSGVVVDGGSAVVHNTTALNNDTGFYTLSGDLSLDNCVAAGNTNGVDISAGNGSVTACTISNNTGIGIKVENFGHAMLIRNTITRNGVGIDCIGATAHSTGDNAVENNNAVDTCVLGVVTVE